MSIHSLNNLQNPPVCEKHKEEMILYVYDRPGSPPGNGWSCRACAYERSAGPQPATRWGEEAEL
jgi:hypothetical protein